MEIRRGPSNLCIRCHTNASWELRETSLVRVLSVLWLICMCVSSYVVSAALVYLFAASIMPTE